MGGAVSAVGSIVGAGTKNIGSALGDITGANAARDAAMAGANAAGQASAAQQAEAKRQFDLINAQGLQLQQDVMAQANRYSVQELNALDRSLAAQTNNLANQERLMAAINPTLMESSEQALRLLRGESAASLGPLQNQRATQRQALVNRLREQYGAGAESSSVGVNALNRFDAETANVLNNAQQASLQTLLGTTLSARPNLAGEAQSLAGIGQAFGNVGSRNANLLAGIGTTRLGALSGAGQNLIQNAGGQFTGQVLASQAQAQHLTNQANLMGGLIGTGLGAMIGGPVGASAGSKMMTGGGGTMGVQGFPSTSSNSYWGGANPYAS